MRLWLSKNSEVPIHEQLVTQLILGIVSNDLKVKQRLPSTRDLARRYDIHANTVSAAYRELAKRGWVEFRKGSGVYVRQRSHAEREKHLALDQVIGRFFRDLRDQGHSLAQIQAAVAHSFTLQPPDHFLLVEPDIELRSILVAEVSQLAKVKIAGAGPEDLQEPNIITGAVPIGLFGHVEEAFARLTSEAGFLILHSASVAESLKGQKRPSVEALVAIVSRWPEFLRWAKTMLLAAGLDGDALSFRDARQRGWDKGLRSAAFVITDSLMAPRIPANCEVKVFRILATSSINEIREYAERNFPT